MAKGISLHIGLNSVDPDQYDGRDGALNACEFDAKDMQAIAKKQKFGSSQLLLTRNGTCAAVTAAISDAAKRLSSGDIFFLSYSGHGGQVPHTVGQRVYKAHKKQYDAIQAKNKAAERIALKATVLLISGCQDNQVSLDGSRNGLFTQMLKRVWSGGRFQFGYRRFRDTIVAQMPATQTPNYFAIGAASPTFESQKPFTV